MSETNPKPPTPRARAIAYRRRAIEREQRVIRTARGNYLFSAEETREAAREILGNLRRELAVLEAMPADASHEEVGRAMGVS